MHIFVERFLILVKKCPTMDNTQGKIVRKGTNYVVLETNDGLNKFWISDLIEAKKITKTKQAKGEVGDMKGTQPAKYYSKDAEGDDMSLATKKGSCKTFSQKVIQENLPWR